MAMLLSILTLFSLLETSAAPQAPPRKAEIEITGRVLDMAGKPAANVPVALLALPTVADARSLQVAGKPDPDPRAQTATDADGRFLLTTTDTGMYRVEVRGVETVPMEVDLFPLLAAVELPPLRLEKSVPLRVRVIGSDGRARADVRIAAWPNRSSRRRGLEWQLAARSGVPDGGGVVVFPRRAGESLDLAAAGNEVPESRASRTTGTAVDLRAERPCPRVLLVRDAPGQAVAGAFVVAEPLVVGVTAADGSATVAASCTRETRLTVETAEGARARVRLQPAPPESAAAPVAVTLEPPVRSTGRVIDAETRAPLAGALVWRDDDPAGSVRTDAKGVYIVTRPPAAADAAVQLRAAAPAHLPRAETIVATRTAGPTFALQPTSVLAGVVVDAKGNAVPSAEIDVDESSSESILRFGPRAEGLPWRAVSRGNGAFRIEVLPRRAYTLRARRAGYAPASLAVAEKLAPAATRSGLRIVLVFGGAAAGSVVDGRSSRPVAGAELRLVTATAASELPHYLRRADETAEPEVRAYSDAAGAFRFEHLAPGRFDLFVKAEGFAPRAVRGIVIESAEGATTLGTVALEPGIVLEGSVVDDRDRPLPGVTVAVVPPSPAGIRADVLSALGDPDAVREATTDSEGRFTLSGLKQGQTVDITARRRGYVPATLPRVELPTSEPVRIALDVAARASGRVVSDRGEPVIGAIVSARPADAALPAGLSGATTSSDAEGAFVLEDLGAGKVSIGALAKGFVSGEPLLLDLQEGRSVDGLELTLRRGAVIEGSVLTPVGWPAAAARVVLRRNSSPDRMLEIEVAGAAHTDGDGRYRLEGAPLGPQSVSADQEGFLRSVRDVDVQPGENHLDLRLGEGAGLSGRVVDQGGRGLGGVAVALLSSVPGIAKEDISDGDGRFRFAGLESGHYELSARKGGYSSARQEVHVAAQSVDGVELRLRQGGGVIAGRLLGLTPDEMPQLQITALKRPLDTLDALRQGRADHQGSYRIEGVYPGDWTVTARLPNGRQARRSISIAEENPEVQLDLDFGAGVTLSGSVRRRGQPVSDVSVQASGLSSDSSGSSLTDSAGAFRISGLQMGDHRVVALLAQLGLRSERLVTLSGDQNLEIDLPTARAGGRVIDAATGSPLAGVVVSAEPSGGPAGTFAPRTTSDADGAFVLNALGKGSYSIRGEKAGYTRAELRVELPDDAAAVDNLRLSLDPERGLILDVAGTAGAPPGRIGVALLDAAGLPVFSQATSTGENGRTRIPNAPNGRFRLLVGADGAATTSLPVEIPGPPVPVRLARSARLTVQIPELIGKSSLATLTILAVSGEPFRSVSGGTVQQQWPVMNGRTTVDALPAGNWTLLAAGADHRQWRGSVTLWEGQTAETALK
jgi:protocatechuate 3,4-dioxygenase beta subunit